MRGWREGRREQGKGMERNAEKQISPGVKERARKENKKRGDIFGCPSNTFSRRFATGRYTEKTFSAPPPKTWLI